MIRIISLFVIFALALPVQAEMLPDADREAQRIKRENQKEQDRLLENQKLRDKMNYREPSYIESHDAFRDKSFASDSWLSERFGSNWWKWALGVVVIGGVAVAATGSGSSNGNDSGGGSTGNGTITW